MGIREEVGGGLTCCLAIGHLDHFKVVGWVSAVGGCRWVKGRRWGRGSLAGLPSVT